MQTPSDRTFEQISTLMHASIGLSSALSKKPLISSRLSPRIQRLGLDSFEDYVAMIEADEAGEFQMAVDLLTTNETHFFREPAHDELLEKNLARQKPRTLRVWSAASSFGDEAYSTGWAPTSATACCKAPAGASSLRTGCAV